MTLQVVSKQGEVAYKSSPVSAHTRPVPSGMPRPQILSYDADLASRDRWLFGAVEDSLGGGPYGYYAETFWLYVTDRSGRIVSYYADPASNATTSFQRRARDGEYIVLEKRCYGCNSYSESVVRMTLDYGTSMKSQWRAWQTPSTSPKKAACATTPRASYER